MLTLERIRHFHIFHHNRLITNSIECVFRSLAKYISIIIKGNPCTLHVLTLPRCKILFNLHCEIEKGHHRSQLKYVSVIKWEFFSTLTTQKLAILLNLCDNLDYKKDPMLDAHRVKILLVTHNIVGERASCAHEQFCGWRQKFGFQGHKQIPGFPVIAPT